eukprot:4252744-Amphidinium_carterae.1
MWQGTNATVVDPSPTAGRLPASKPLTCVHGERERQSSACEFDSWRLTPVVLPPLTMPQATR